jgi:hypothetical protein
MADSHFVTVSLEWNKILIRDNLSFVGTCCLHFSEELFYPEDGGSKVLVSIY